MAENAPTDTGAYIDPNSGAAAQPGGYAGAPTVDLSSQSEDTTIGDVGADTATLDAMRQTSGGPGGSQPGDEKDEEETDGDDEAQSADASTKTTPSKDTSSKKK